MSFFVYNYKKGEAYMRIRDIIDLLESQGEWVNRSCTRDRILFGDDQRKTLFLSKLLL